MRSEYSLLIGVLAQAVTDKPLTVPQDVDWQLFARLCKAHAVQALAHHGLEKAGVQPPPEVQKTLAAAYGRAIFMDVQFDNIKSRLSAAMALEGVDHIFLKGASLKGNYPIPALRSMGDLDVLVKIDDFEKIHTISTDLGAQADHVDGNHRNYIFPGNVVVEFHPNLIHMDVPVATGINPGWQYAAPGDSPARELTQEGFYLNTICHMANHFVGGGVGIRFLLDLWINRHRRTPQPDRAFVETELERFGLLRFARNLEDLAEAWFGDGALTPELEELGEYILTSGIHGREDRAMLNAVTLSQKGTGASALAKMAFRSRQELESRYPWCRGRGWLLPAAWCVRAVKAVTTHGGLILKWSKGTGKISREETDRQKQMLERFGIELQ